MKKQVDQEPLRFLLQFVTLFTLFFFFNKYFFSITQPGPNYHEFLATHLNYVAMLRGVLLNCSAKMINSLGYAAITNDFQLLVAGHGIIEVVYSCLGLGLMSFFAAFVLSYPKAWKSRLIFLFCGSLMIELINVLRFVLLALFWDKKANHIADHHTIFNLVIYLLVAISLYFWTRPGQTSFSHAKN